MEYTQEQKDRLTEIYEATLDYLQVFAKEKGSDVVEKWTISTNTLGDIAEYAAATLFEESGESIYFPWTDIDGKVHEYACKEI